MSGLCLAAGKILAALPIASFTLAWTHSIEKSRWEEDWAVVGHSLVLREARIRGAGAGMEPPPGARLENGIWHFVPPDAVLDKLRLTHSPHVAGYEFCTAGHCQPLVDLLTGVDDNAVIEVSVCTDR